MSIRGNIIRDEMYVQLGGDVIRHSGQATTTTALGTVIVNAAEGIMYQTVQLPIGVTSVNKDYILNYLENHPDGRLVEEHTAGNNNLKVGRQATPYLIAPGVILVEHSGFCLKFDGKPMERKEFPIPQNPNIHITEREDIVIDANPHTRGRDPRS